MNILYVITRSDVIGGASVHLLDLALGVQNLGHDVVLYVGGDGIFVDKARSLGLTCIELKYMRRNINPFYDLLSFIELRKIFKIMRPDLVHLHSSKAGILGRLAASNACIPSIFTAHGWAFTDGVSPLKRFLYIAIERFMAKFSDKIITVSEYDRKLALDLKVGCENLITTVLNGMPNVIYLPKSYTNSRVIKLIMVARFDAQKAQLLLIDALAKINNKNWLLEFVGDGPLKEEAISHTIECGLEKHISFSGACNDVSNRLDNSDVFLLVSNWEGLPLTILEAMRSGLPVIASDVGGVKEAVVDGLTGLLVERGNQLALAQAIQKLMDSSELWLSFGIAGRNRFEQVFLYDFMLNKTLDIYQQVVKK